jgi:hypothetical protein
MSLAKTDPLTPQAAASLLEAAYCQGWLMAGAAIQHLEGAGILPARKQRRQTPVHVAPAILMELAAMLRLAAWQAGGLCHAYEAVFAPAFAALEESLARLTADPDAFAQQAGMPPVADEVLRLWEQQFAWRGLEELHADVLLALERVAEDRVLEVLADFLWNHRHSGRPPTGS